MYVRAGGKAVGEIAKARGLCSKAAIRSLGGISLAAASCIAPRPGRVGVHIPLVLRLLCSLGIGRACEVVLSLSQSAAVAELAAEHYWCSGGGGSHAEIARRDTPCI